jgi:LuxR family maltose regulon positive regulatory protein
MTVEDVRFFPFAIKHLMEHNLLATKVIVPTRRADMLRRQRLLDFLHAYLDRKLLLVSASAGYGKTSLLVDFCADTELPVCWYSLDAGDKDPALFLEYLVAALQRRFPRFGGRITALLRQAEPRADLDACVGALVTDLQQEIDTFFVLVLDDYHLVESSAPINQLLDRLLLYLPENAHLILASRTVPTGLTLTRLTARQEVAGLGVNDLRFTAEEIRAFVEKKYDLEITPDTARELAAQSEGWIAGLVLTTPRLWRGVFQEWVKTSGPGSQLFDYLASEVLAQQPPELQQFLLDTSVLAELNAGECNELLGRTDAQTQFLIAERRNLFVARLEEAGYRYHHLFREFLQARLRETQPARWLALQERAAALYERRGRLDLAIEYWFAAEQPAQAARVLAIVVQEYYERGRWTTLMRWLDALPEAELEKFPALLLCRAQLKAESGALPEAQTLFVRARAEFQAQGELVQVARTWLEQARYEADAAVATRMCESAQAILPENDFVWQALVQRTMGIIASRQGDIPRAVKLFERASKLYEIANARALQADAESDLGAMYLAIGDRARAEFCFNNALQHAQRVRNAVKLANALNSIATTRYQKGELSAALELLQEALPQARAAGHLRIEAYVRASLGEVRRDRGELPEALEDFNAASEIAEKIREPFLLTFVRVAIGDVWRLSGDLATAERVLQSAMQVSNAHHSGYEVALVQLGFGALKLALDEPNAAEHHLMHALPLLERANAKREQARAFFYLARVALLKKQQAIAVRHLRALVRLGKELGEDQFLIADAARTPELFELAFKRHVGVSYFRRLQKKLERHPLRPPPIVPMTEEKWVAMDLFALGEARVLLNGVPVAFPTLTTKELFFFFALFPQEWRKEEVIAKLWGDISPGQGNDLFHSSVYRLRRSLFQDVLVYRNGLYQLNPEVLCRIDSVEFERLLDQAQVASAEQMTLLERAVKLYAGDLLDEIYRDWCNPLRERLRTRFLGALLQLAQGYMDLQDFRSAQKWYETLLRYNPLDEAIYRALMRLHMLTGERLAALQVYRECAETLAEELGVAPMPETESLYRSLLGSG